MKNFLLKTLTIIFAFTLILGIFTACGEPETPVHTHDYINKICTVCGAKQPSEGLVYNDITIGGIDGWCVSGIGTCTDTEVVIANKYLNKPVLSIGDYAFLNCTSLTSVTIDNNVTSIGYGAFYRCSLLTSVTIGNNVTSIGDFAFSSCDLLTSVVIPNSVASIGEYAFSNCDSLEYNISDGLKYLGNSENQYLYLAGVVDRNITTATINNNCKVIGYNAFSNCDSLEYNISDGLKYLGNSENQYLYLAGVVGRNITTATINNNCKVIGSRAFFDCTSLTSIVIPNSVTSIGNRAFVYCSSLTSIKVDENNANYKSIDGNLYSKDGKTLIQYAIGKTATSFDMPNSVTSIGDNAFSYCDSLTSVVIPNSVTSIGNSAFRGCDSLTSIVIPNSVISIGDWVFDRCNSLTIYCKAESEPIGWSGDWNSSNRPVVWGYKGN